MRNSNFVTTVTRTFHMTKFRLKKHSPEILIVTGVIGTIASTVMACKATTKVREVLDDTKQQVEVIHSCAEQGHILNPNTMTQIEYTEEDSKKDLAIVYAHTGLEFVKLYGPSVALGALSLASIIGSNHILRKRNMALAAAYTAVDNGFKQYRGRVIERFGEALDRELKYNIKAKEIEEVVTDENGEEKTVSKVVDVIEDPNYISQYAFFFDNGCPGWTKDEDHNRMFVIQQQNYANDRLRLEGHLFLNDVREMFGLPRTKSGQVVGWIYDEKNPIGDNFVDLGIFNVHSRNARDFVNGYERTILLDPNVDGNILDLI